MAGSLTVLHAIPTLVGGGAERQLALLAKEQSSMGLDVHVVCTGGGIHEAQIRAVAKLHMLPKRGNHDPALMFRMWQLMRRLRPDVVQTWLTQMDILAGITAQSLAIPHVLSERASARGYPPSWKNGLRRHVGVRADAIVANSRTGLRYWEEAGMRGLAGVIRNGSSVESIASAVPRNRAESGLPAEGPVVLFAGRLVEQKNLPVLMDAFTIVLQAEPTAACLLFGEGPEREWLERRIATMRGGNRIQVRGYTTALPAWMKAASVLVSTSRFEGAPNVVIEAMLAGCPLAVSDIPEHRELVDDAQAVLFQPDNHEAAAAGILAVLRDPEASAQRSKNALATASTWTIPAAAQAYERLYRTLTWRK